MEKSQTLSELAKALNKFQSLVQAVKKDGNNPFFKSKYATLENIIETIRQPLKETGLSFTQFPTGENELITILMHTSGEFIQSAVKMTPKDATPQGQGSAITYMRRYALSAVLGIASEEDDDGNTATFGNVKSFPVRNPTRKVPVDPDWKKTVKESCDRLNPLLQSKEDYEAFVKEKAGMELKEENAEVIIQTLKSLK